MFSVSYAQTEIKHTMAGLGGGGGSGEVLKCGALYYTLGVFVFPLFMKVRES